GPLATRFHTSAMSYLMLSRIAADTWPTSPKDDFSLRHSRIFSSSFSSSRRCPVRLSCFGRRLGRHWKVEARGRRPHVPAPWAACRGAGQEGYFRYMNFRHMPEKQEGWP